MHTYIHAYSTYIYFEKDNSSSSSFLRGDFGFGGNALRRHPDWADINCETLKQKLTSRCHNIGLRPGTIWQHEQVGHEPLPAAPPPPHTTSPPSCCLPTALWSLEESSLLWRSPWEVTGQTKYWSCVWYTPVFFFPLFFLSLSSRWCLMSHPQQHLPLLISRGASDSSDLESSTFTGPAKWLAMRPTSEVGIPMAEEKRLGTRPARRWKRLHGRFQKLFLSVITWYQ